MTTYRQEDFPELPDKTVMDSVSGLAINIPLGMQSYPGWWHDDPATVQRIKELRSKYGITVEDDMLSDETEDEEKDVYSGMSPTMPMQVPLHSGEPIRRPKIVKRGRGKKKSRMRHRLSKMLPTEVGSDTSRPRQDLSRREQREQHKKKKSGSSGRRRTFNEGDHPRADAGTSEGGQFVARGRGKGGSRKENLKGEHTVRSGDTLSEIAKRYGMNWRTLYALNRAVIERDAREHGFHDSDGGNRIWPGLKLRVPDRSENSS